MSLIKVLVVEDHALFRRGLCEVLAEESDMEVVGEAGNGLEAIRKAAELAPDVVCMDLNMPGPGGIETSAYLAHAYPEAKILILTVSEEPGDLFQALGVGARGYVLKNAHPREIVDALRQVYQGWVVISPSMAPRFISDLGQPAPSKAGKPDPAEAQVSEAQLTFREQEILGLVAQGLSNADIADSLTVSENTVKTHVKNILGKLQIKNRRQAAAYAAKVASSSTPQDGPARPGG